MKGLITDGKGNVLLKDDIPKPDIGDYDALVQTVGCGICNGTELKIMRRSEELLKPENG